LVEAAGASARFGGGLWPQRLHNGNGAATVNSPAAAIPLSWRL